MANALLGRHKCVPLDVLASKGYRPPPFAPEFSSTRYTNFYFFYFDSFLKGRIVRVKILKRFFT